MYQRIQKSSHNHPNQQQSSPSTFQAQHPRIQLTQEKIENETFGQHKFEASGLQLKRERGTITPQEQEKLAVLQAKMDDFWVQRQEKASQFSYKVDSILGVHNKAGVQPIQAKLTIGQPNDKYEQEADRVALQVVNQINTPGSQQLQPELQPPSDSGVTTTADLASSIQRARTGGQPLAGSIRKKMEGAFGADFSGVKIHTDAQSNQLNQSIQARAFTTGQDVFFGEGEYNPRSQGGQVLLAHELTHVIQQSSSKLQRSVAPEDRLPTAHQIAASSKALGQTPEIVQSSPPGRLHRCPLGKKKNKGQGKVKGKGNKENSLSPEEKFISAYKEARVFHGTHEENVDSILKEGLKTDKTGTGAIAINPKEYGIDEKVVHLGLTSELSKGYARGGKRGLLRPFLPAERKTGKPKLWGSDHRGFPTTWNPEVPDNQLVYDEKHRGGEAVITKEDVPGKSILAGKHEDLLDSKEKDDQERLETILSTIGTHYETLHGEPAPDMEELKQIYENLVRERRLSVTDTDHFG